MAWSMLYGAQILFLDIGYSPTDVNSRELFFPGLDADELPAHVYLRSVHNISIERSWLRLRLDFGDTAIAAFGRGQVEFGYNDQNDQQ